MTERILIVDDDPDLLEILVAGFAVYGIDAATCSGAAEALARLGEETFATVLTDVHMPGMRGDEFCRLASAAHPELPIVVMTAHANLDTAIAALRAGARDFFNKPLHIESTALRLRRLIEEHALRCEVRRLRDAAGRPAAPGLLGESPAMRAVYDLMARVYAVDASVLITGETGTGKEVVARALHERSPRREGPFVAVNCSAIPEGVFESELFGHTRGAFTDARSERAGLLVQAHRGTLFLDEFGELPLMVQPRLLRALEERAVRPVGASREVPVDIRLIAATNRDIEDAAAEGRFRVDLLFRVNVIHIHLPPLRARGRDVLTLAQHFVERFAAQVGKPVRGLQPAAAERLLAYPWPGNVRELRNCVERAVALTTYDAIGADDLPPKIREYRSEHVLIVGDDPSELVTMDEVERRYITRVLGAVGGNKTVAAKVLGLDRKTLYRKLERYERELSP